MHVLLADDHDLVRDSVKAYLERLDPSVEVETVSDLEAALALVTEGHDFDIVLLDLKMPGMNGVEGLRRMRTACPDVPLAILSGAACTPDLVAALHQAGASFVPKTLSGKRLLSVMRFIVSGEVYVPPSMVGASLESGMPSPAGPAADFQRLTRREAQVLSWLVKGFANKEIARELAIEEVTVKLHLRGIFRKLHAKNRIQAVRQAIDRGLAV